MIRKMMFLAKTVEGGGADQAKNEERYKMVTKLNV